MRPFLFALFLFFLLLNGHSQTTNLVILNSREIKNLKSAIRENDQVKVLFDSIIEEAKTGLDRAPKPVKIIYYEGLLNTNPKRVETVKSFRDIDYVISLIYTSYGNQSPVYRKKAKEIIVAWAKTYKPTGNPINENKFVAFFWGYHLFKNYFNEKEKEIVENWLMEIANMEMNRDHTPNTNWEAKRCKMIGIIGCVLEKEKLKNHSIQSFKKYISSSYYEDGTSRDLEQRDALHYHVSGLKPCVSAFINLSKYDSRFELFDFVSEKKSSVRKSVEYVVPYATGQKQREEWRNTKVKLDKERAAAGLTEYQPGKLFEPQEAYSLFELACYYNAEWISIFEEDNKITSWIGFLNSPLIRK